MDVCDEREVARGAPAPAPDCRAGNALTHGLTAQRVLEAEREAYEQHHMKLELEYEPETAAERALVRRVARLIVRLDRAARVDAVAFANCWYDRPGADGDDTGRDLDMRALHNHVQTIDRYERALGRALAKAIHELERLICARTGEAVVQPCVIDFNW